MNEIEDSLEALPDGVLFVYEMLIRKYVDLRPSSSALAGKILMWAGYARRPLLVEELAEAVAIDVAAVPILSPQTRLLQPKRVLTICPQLTSMVTIQTAGESHEAVTLIHTAIRVLMAMRLSSWNAHMEISRSCLEYLCLLDQRDILNSPDYGQRFPLADYAARFWHYHMEEADGLTRNHDDLPRNLGPLHRAATKFFCGSSKICHENWVKLFNPDRPWDPQPGISDGPRSVSTPLYYASCLGLPSLLDYLLVTQDSNDINAADGTHGTALHAAAYHGHVTIVKLLLEHDADPFIRGGLHGTALQAAKFVGHLEITELL